MYSSFNKERLFMSVSLYMPKINSFPFLDLFSNVSIFIEDANWKVSIFLHYMEYSGWYKTLNHLCIYLDLCKKYYHFRISNWAFGKLESSLLSLTRKAPNLSFIITLKVQVYSLQSLHSNIQNIGLKPQFCLSFYWNYSNLLIWVIVPNLNYLIYLKN